MAFKMHPHFSRAYSGKLGFVYLSLQCLKQTSSTDEQKTSNHNIENKLRDFTNKTMKMNQNYLNYSRTQRYYKGTLAIADNITTYKKQASSTA